jgi:outer membrane receptor for ferrienterochelin and colicins
MQLCIGMKQGVLFIFFIFPISLFSQSQWSKDTLQFQGDTVVVTATKTERKLSNSTVPVTIIGNKQIQQTGALRLTDILKEQPGLIITSGFGAGVQLQGLNPDYTIILINGEPLVGRTAGVLDLNRISLGNIKKIEIVKGPSSSLYGSEAMAGVVNIITDASSNIPLQANIRYGTYQTLDAAINQTAQKNSNFYQGYYNYFSTNGYSIRPNSSSRVTTPIERFTVNQQYKHYFGANTQLLMGGRFTDEQIQNNISVSNGGATINSNGKEHNTDYNLNASLNHNFSTHLKTSFRTYLTNYNAKQDLLTLSGEPYYDLLNHLFKRIENQTDWNINTKTTLLVGAGSVWEGVKSTRYDSEHIRKTNTNSYAFTQVEYSPSASLIMIGGVRFDHNETYASALSPKFSILYKLNTKNKIRLSIGQGFKAPDFRQLYLDFTNAAAGGYSVFGTVQAQKVIDQLNALGQIGVLYDNFYQLKTLQPEFSTGVHLSWEYEPSTSSQYSIQLFRNDIKNLIQVQQVGAYKTGAQIFSYLNIGRAFTEGLELEYKKSINSQWMISGGYQYLVTGDKDQIAQIKAGTVYTRDANGYSKRLSLSDYVGLPNNSTHKGQLKIAYNNAKGVFINLRAMYRSEWAVNNTNGNEVFDKGDSFAMGYLSLHSNIGKQFNNQFSAQVGCDNITNYIDAANLPNLPGRTFYISLKYQFKTKK